MFAASLKYYEKVYETFPGDNIRANAIKYLYFKLKPGGYMLPYLQEESKEESKETVPQRSSLSLKMRSLFTHDAQKKE